MFRPTVRYRKNPDVPTRQEIITENIVDALIDGLIAGLATGFLANPEIGWKVALATGLMKFLIRLKELRGK